MAHLLKATWAAVSGGLCSPPAPPSHWLPAAHGDSGVAAGPAPPWQRGGHVWLCLDGVLRPSMLSPKAASKRHEFVLAQGLLSWPFS